MEEPTTLKIRCFFDAKDPDGIPWITLEIPSPRAINLPINAELGFELTPGTTTDKAIEIVNLLNEYVTNLLYTVYPPQTRPENH